MWYSWGCNHCDLACATWLHNEPSRHTHTSYLTDAQQLRDGLGPTDLLAVAHVVEVVTRPVPVLRLFLLLCAVGHRRGVRVPRRWSPLGHAQVGRVRLGYEELHTAQTPDVVRHERRRARRLGPETRHVQLRLRTWGVRDGAGRGHLDRVDGGGDGARKWRRVGRLLVRFVVGEERHRRLVRPVGGAGSWRWYRVGRTRQAGRGGRTARWTPRRRRPRDDRRGGSDVTRRPMRRRTLDVHGRRILQQRRLVPVLPFALAFLLLFLCLRWLQALPLVVLFLLAHGLASLPLLHRQTAAVLRLSHRAPGALRCSRSAASRGLVLPLGVFFFLLPLRWVLHLRDAAHRDHLLPEAHLQANDDLLRC